MNTSTQHNISALAIFTLLLLSCNMSPAETEIDEPSQMSIGVSEKVSLETFEQIQNGMSLEEVETILGPGRETTSQDIDDVQISVYRWQDPNFSNITIRLIVQNGVVTAKTHTDLE
ncbi:MAG: hypothetical protein AAF572_24475 [Cyanobacteria bacterium P01_B01_bin.77]